MDATEASINGRMNKKDVSHTHTHDGILFSHEKGGDPAISDNMDIPWWHYTKWNKHLPVEFFFF